MRTVNYDRRAAQSTCRSAGLSLLEVILALAILGGSLAVLGQIVRIGTRSARQARGRVAAELHCASLLAEIVTGIRPAEPVQGTMLEFPDPEYSWFYTIEVQPTDREGMLVVRVTVYENKPVEASPVRVSLVRWMIDPEFEAEAAAADEENASQTGDTAPDGSSESSSEAPGSGSSPPNGTGGGSAAGGAGGGGGSPGRSP